MAMADLAITNLAVGENESGLLYWAEADIVEGVEKTRVRVYFIDMPMFDDKANLRMDGVGDLLRRAYEETLHPSAPVPTETVFEEMPEAPPAAAEVATPPSPKLLKARRDKLAVLAASCKAARPTALVMEREAL